jgi:glucan phosphoethanolaminetransferase (alkaline phosphatase superfamily)
MIEPLVMTNSFLTGCERANLLPNDGDEGEMVIIITVMMMVMMVMILMMMMMMVLMMMMMLIMIVVMMTMMMVIMMLITMIMIFSYIKIGKKYINTNNVRYRYLPIQRLSVSISLFETVSSFENLSYTRIP